MDNRDSREIGRHYEQRVLRSLHKFGFLRTRDLAALLWSSSIKGRGGFEPLVIEVSASARRMAQRTLRRLRQVHMVIWLKAPDGSVIYGLSEAGARQLVNSGIPAKSGKDIVRRVSLSHFHHRRIANEIAIGALLQGFRANSEHEIAMGDWLGGKQGVEGKKPDVVVRDGKNVWFLEVERSRRNERDYAKLINFLMAMWPDGRNAYESAELPGGHKLCQVVFISDAAFVARVHADLKKAGWNEEMIAKRVSAFVSLYITEAKYIVC
jgi:hypothetical protein